MKRILLLLASLPALAEEAPFDAWSHIAQYDANGDDRITREEFRGRSRTFNRLDLNGEGVVTREEAGGGRRTSDMERVDADKDGTVSAEEWLAAFEKADENGDGVLDKEELDAALRGGEFRDSAPKKGDPAPKVSASRLKGGAVVDLSVVRRPTVLVFGSYT